MHTTEERPAAQPVTRLLGRVESVGAKGFGFIQTDSHEQYFFHRRDVDIQRLPTQHSMVTFEPAACASGGNFPRALKVHIVSEPRSKRR